MMLFVLLPLAHTRPRHPGAPLSRSERQVAKIALRAVAGRLQLVATSDSVVAATREVLTG